MGMLSANWLRAHGLAPADVLIETGTSGARLKYCVPDFGAIHTVDLDENRCRAVAAAVARYPTIRVHCGHSPAVIAWLAEPSQATSFFLDAHWVPHANYLVMPETPCPVLEELRAIFAIPWQTAPRIAVDDAWLFRPEYGWKRRRLGYRKAILPTLGEIEEVCRSFGYAVKVVEDRLVITSDAARA